ncbi:hypothetical protein LIER_33368 [Lithospermum erythrorhizon]|uniref:Uncharacterized protein n=1 Tax=Lithospermum erythrorhizon TaxID=34254 RepID=A0AAV3RZW9_LITER
MRCRRGGKHDKWPGGTYHLSYEYKMEQYKNNQGRGKHLKGVDRETMSRINNHDQHPCLPPVRNTSSMDQILREYEKANIETFMRNSITNEIEVTLYAEIDTLDRRSGGGHHVHCASASSSEEDEMAEEETGHPSTHQANSVVRGEGSEATQVPQGHARPHTLTPRQNKLKAYLYMGDLVGEQVSSWFLPEMRFEYVKCWHRWKNVDSLVQELLWNNFKNYFDLEVDESMAKNLFYKQATTWYRRDIGVVKREALHVAKTDDVRDLIGKPMLPWMQTQAVWNSFVDHWTTPKALQLSESAKKSRATKSAGEHGLGNVSLKNRMRIREEKTGVQPAPFEILLEQNHKKNSISGDCDVHN